MQNCDCICKWLACVNSFKCKTPNRCLFCPLNGRIRSRRATEGRGCNAELCKNTGLHEYIYHIETRHHNSTLFDAVNTASKKRTNLPHW